ncbi:uncharacterized protein METZ01_LOCUS454832 [marine metagenome]|uniref:Uncharacterized protein n=1 Tax=marine metagenome TaxID=408172 RepID=A0A383A4R0_9ZZZZ
MTLVKQIKLVSGYIAIKLNFTLIRRNNEQEYQ